jgi:hypothetical protein
MADLKKMFGAKPTQPAQQETINAPSADTHVQAGPAPDHSNESAEQPAASAAQVAPKVNPFARAVKVPDTQAATQKAAAAARAALAPSNPEPAAAPAASHAGDGRPDGAPVQGAVRVFGKGVAATESEGDDSRSGVEPTPAGDRVNPLQTLQSLPSLEALESIDLSDLATEARPMSTFADETPATKPTRELPADLEPQGRLFVKLIDNIYDPMILHDPELLGSVIRNIMVELKSKRAFMDLIAPEDVRTWVRAMRSSMGLARIKKQEKKTGARGGSRKSAAVDNDMMSDLDSLVAGLD